MAVPAEAAAALCDCQRAALAGWPASVLPRTATVLRPWLQLGPWRAQHAPVAENRSAGAHLAAAAQAVWVSGRRRAVAAAAVAPPGRLDCWTVNLRWQRLPQIALSWQRGCCRSRTPCGSRGRGCRSRSSAGRNRTGTPGTCGRLQVSGESGQRLIKRQLCAAIAEVKLSATINPGHISCWAVRLSRAAWREAALAHPHGQGKKLRSVWSSTSMHSGHTRSSCDIGTISQSSVLSSKEFQSALKGCDGTPRQGKPRR